MAARRVVGNDKAKNSKMNDPGVLVGGGPYLGDHGRGIKRREDGTGGEELLERKTGGRRKIPIEFIEDKSRRHITFSKRKAGIMKKAYELSTLTGTQVLLLVASETGHVYTFATPKLQPLITKPEGKNLIQACLNAPDPPMQQTSNVPNTAMPPTISGIATGMPPAYTGFPGPYPSQFPPSMHGTGIPSTNQPYGSSN